MHDPQRRTLVDDEIAQDLLSLQLAAERVVVVAIDLKGYFLALSLLFYQKIDIVVVDRAFSQILVA